MTHNIQTISFNKSTKVYKLNGTEVDIYNGPNVIGKAMAYLMNNKIPFKVKELNGIRTVTVD